MINVKICDVAPRSACAYYRGMGVFQKLRHLDPDIHIEHCEAVSWTMLNDCDILFLMRPVENNYIESLELAQSYGVPVWVDFDDILHEIPRDNPSYDHFTHKHRRENIIKCLQRADIVTFSTVELKKYYEKVCPDSIVIENAFNDYNYSLAEDHNAESQIISWRGSDTHRKDLLSAKESMVSVSNEFRDWLWFFIGCTPWYITEELQNARIQEQIEIIRYNRLLINLKAAIHIVPLVDSIFNRGKSNIAWLEATSAGSACLCPEMIKSKSFRRESFQQSKKYIQENLLLSDVNKKRLKIIKENI